MKKPPVILITGTPGTGKSTLVNEICDNITEINHIDIGKIAKDNNFYLEYDDEYECHVIDEEKVIDDLEERLKDIEVCTIIDYHSADIIPKNIPDAIFILRTDNTILYDRLQKRNYDKKKLEDNIQSEIFQTILDDAKETFGSDLVHELISNTPEDMESNAQTITSWINNYYNSPL